MATTTLTKQDTDRLGDELRPILESHETIYAVVKHVSRTGMSRVIDFYVIDGTVVGGTPNVLAGPGLRRISHMLAAVYNRKTDGSSRGWTSDVGGVLVHGCGMDMGWHVVYSVRRALGLGATGPQYERVRMPSPALRLSSEDGLSVPYLQRDYQGRPCHLGYGFRIEYL